jgi:PAS domain S-box-containing protein
MTDSIQVLHVDDDEGYGDLVVDYLERETDSVDVITVTSAVDGLGQISSEKPDCIVSDYEMPNQNGIEFLEAVRADHPELPLILFTGKGSEEVASDAISAGATDYLQKGVGSDQFKLLANRIQNAVTQYQSQRRLERERSRMEFALESTNAAIWTRDIETDEMEIHPSVCPVFDTTIGSFGEWLDNVHPSDRTEVEETVRSAAEDGTSYSFQLRFLTDGDIRWGEMNGQTIVEDGDAAFQTGFTRDITEQKERKRRFETLTRNLPGMVYRCRNERGWPMEDVHGNVEAFTGYTAEEIESNEILWGEEVIHPEDREWLWESAQESLDTGDSFEVTYRIRTNDGEIRWVWERGRGVFGPDGKLEALEGFITDITDRKEHEQRLQETNRQFQAVLDTVEAAIFIKDRGVAIS